MAFFKSVRKTGSLFFNFRIDRWLGINSLKTLTQDTVGDIKDTLTPKQSEIEETFEEALQRMNLSEQELHHRIKTFRNFFYFYLLIAISSFAYSCYIATVFKNYYGFFMGLAVTLLALSNAFRYHFWLYQILHRRLGCTLKDWFLNK